MWADFASKWFALYYPILGLTLLVSGIGLMVKKDAVYTYFISESKSDQPPAIPRTILKYLFLFTLPCLVLSLVSFSWSELLFSLWSLVMVYIAGIQLVRWPDQRQTVKNHPDKIRKLITITAAMLLTVSPVMFLLSYIVIQRLLK